MSVVSLHIYHHLDGTVRLHLSAHGLQLVVVHLANLVDRLRHLVLPEVARFWLRVAVRQYRHLSHLLHNNERTNLTEPRILRTTV